MKRHRGAPSSAEEHVEWLSLVDVTGPFLTVPVLRRMWPSLDAVDKPTRDALAAAALGEPAEWVDWVLTGLLGWGDALHRAGLDELSLAVPEHDRTLRPDFALRHPADGSPRLLGLVLPPGTHPTARVRDDEWSATPVDRAALLCRARGVELALVTDGRWWALVWAARGQVTSVAVFDSATWTDAADRVVVRAFASLLHRRRFFAVPADETLPALYRASLDNQEEVTEALGVQVRRAVELLVDAIGREDIRLRRAGGTGLEGRAAAHDVYRGAVSVMMRVVFLLFAEERGLLPADNPVYEAAYSAGRLCQELRQQADDSSEEQLEHSTAAWQRLLALFAAVYRGVDHSALTMPAYDGSLFAPDAYPWLTELDIDDRTVLHMLRAVQYVVIGREERRLSFRALDVEQIGYVYEGLLSYDAFRADTTVVGLIGKEGMEAEAHLSELEALAAAHPHVDALAAALADKYKDSKIGTQRALTKHLAPLSKVEQQDALRLLLAVTDGDRALAERLLPFVRILRRDLRGLPAVYLAGSLYVTESPLRRSTGTHYTPRFLAEQVVEGALEPLLYHYEDGPLQTTDQAKWRRRTSKELLELRVADIAMGSGAFLVAACRYLGRALVQAWSAESYGPAREYLAAAHDAPVDTEADPLVVEARREIITHCLYGVDINPMAVEMAKLSLWLVSMDPRRPFTFLDDRLLAGDSLLGVTSVEQIEYLHLDPKRGRTLHEGRELEFLSGVRELIRAAADERRKLAQLPDHTAADNIAKAVKLAQVNAVTARLRLLGDLAAGGALAKAKQGATAVDHASGLAVALAREAFLDRPGAGDKARDQAALWLATDEPQGGFRRSAFHWPIEFPEVFERGGFDAIVGNPPFLGGTMISAPNGAAYREYLVVRIAGGRRAGGRADLVAYFVLRAHQLVNNANGLTGLIATNTLAQADTREVALEPLLLDGIVLRSAVKSRPWPRSAALHYCVIWTAYKDLPYDLPRYLDGIRVKSIGASLDPAGSATGPAYPLVANRNGALLGSKLLGTGFILSNLEGTELMKRDSMNADVLFPYLTGEDLNSQPDCSARRWVIDFADWPLERASQYRECFRIVSERVRPARDRLPKSKTREREAWWRFERVAVALRRSIGRLNRTFALARTSSLVLPGVVPTNQVFSEGVVVFPSEDFALFAVLSSAAHYAWAIARSSTLKGDLRYTPSDVFETFPRPPLTDDMRAAGERLDTFRRDLMLARQAGLTATYNLVHSPSCMDDDIAELRRIHLAIDEAVLRAYGWIDLLDAGLGHDFHDTRQGVRFTVAPAVRQEILDRLLELNHERYAAEQASARQASLWSV